jgi:hypothetical protein
MNQKMNLVDFSPLLVYFEMWNRLGNIKGMLFNDVIKCFIFNPQGPLTHMHISGCLLNFLSVMIQPFFSVCEVFRKKKI